MIETPQIRTHAGQPPIAILGVPFDNLTATDAGELISRMVTSRRAHYLVNLDVDSLVEARRDAEWRKSLFDANLVLCDDAWVIRASRWLGNPVAHRLLGADLVPVLLTVAAEKRFRVFLITDSSEKLNRITNHLKGSHPQLSFSGTGIAFSQKSVHDEAARAIAAAKPDILLVMRDTLEEEKVIATRFRVWSVPVCVGVDVSAAGVLSGSRGTSSRPIGNRFEFIWGVFKQWWQLQFRSGKSSTQVSAPVEAGETWQCIKLPPRLDLQATRDDALLVDQVLADGRDCLLDLAAVQFIDSTGVGLLIRLQKKVRASGKQLILLAPSENVQRALKLMNLQNFFTAAPDLAAARELLTRRTTGG